MGIRVSVVVAARNEERRIARCLRSLVNQHFPPGDFEIILVDGGSRDSTREIAGRFPVQIVLDNHGTLGHQRNTGVKASKGEYVAFIDADCLAEPGWLGLQTAVLDNQSDVAAVTGPNLEVEDDLPLAGTIFHMQQTLMGSGGSPQSYPVKGGLVPVYSAPNCNAVYRRKILAENQYDDRLTYGEDAEINLRLRRGGHRFLYNPDAAVRHHRVASAAGLGRKMYNWGRAISVIARKHRHPVRWYAWLPPAFILYLIMLSIASFITAPRLRWYIPLAFYAALTAASVIQVFFKQRSRFALRAVYLLPLQHISYGLGMLRGLGGSKI